MTLPDQSDELWIMVGVNGFMIAADIRGVGHYTAYPSDKETVALQIPFRDGMLPEHRLVGPGPCHSQTVQPEELELGSDALIDQTPRSVYLALP